MRYTIFDIEADGLYDSVSKIHCLSASIYDKNVLIESVSFTNYHDIIDFLDKQVVLVGHNIIRYDLPVLKKILGYYPNKAVLIDTLALSWYLYPNRPEHGLEYWGDALGVAKPVVEDWQNSSIEEYIHRCETDVVINSILFGQCLNYLKDIYFPEDPVRVMKYLTWKLECAAEQEANPLTINREYCMATLATINALIEDKKTELASVMPRINKYATKSKPSSLTKKDGSLSVSGEKWLDLLSSRGLEADYEGEIQILKSSEAPNPTSVIQLKAWLTTLGWQPTIFNYVPSEEGKVRAIPQLQDKDKNLCPNIVVLSEEYKELEALRGLFMLQHRRGLLEGFLECSNGEGKMRAEIAGFTNTLRFKHKKPIANLPSVDKPYGKQIRGAIIAQDDNHLFCGSDMSSLEDSTKQHYMYFYDPEYVRAMRIPGFDPHLDIAVLSGMLTPEQVEDHKLYDSTGGKEGTSYKKVRSKAKVVNFSGIYGAGPPKISMTTGMSLEEATLLHSIYWERNKSVKQVTNDSVFKEVSGQMWLYNPVSRFWYSLRKPKDRFSTLNQGTGVFCFDTWVRNVRSTGIIINLQYHDEIGFSFPKDRIEETKMKLTTAIQATNDALKLNVPLGISIDIGRNYAEAH
jgi:hypothetical protein